MALDFDKTFGSKPAGKSTGSKADQPKAQFWLNIGYAAQRDTPEGVEDIFISLPMGIPLDTQEALPTNSRNHQYAQFNGARNNLMEQIMDAAKLLAPGEQRVLNLEIQLRRVNEEAADVSNEDNQLIRKLAL